MVNLTGKGFTPQTSGLKDNFEIEIISKKTNDKYCIVEAKVWITTDNPILKGVLNDAVQTIGKTNIFTGKAKCHKDDEFNETKGYDLAEHRARVKALKFIVRVINEAQRTFKYAAFNMGIMKIVAEKKQYKQYTYADLEAHK